MTTSCSRDVRVWTLLAAGAVAVLGATRPARGADDLPPAIQSAGGGRPVREHRWQVSAGGRGSLYRGAGYDPFSTNDVLPQFSTAVTWSLPRRAESAFSSAAGVIGELGQSSAQARGADADLSVTRVGLILEERFSPSRWGRWGYAFARVSPGWMAVEAKLSDPASPAALRSSSSSFALDASLGLAANLNPGARGVGFWLVGDGGYGWAPSNELVLTPALASADAAKAGATSLGTLAPRGAFFRAGVALSF
jgi:hypothetical protein